MDPGKIINLTSAFNFPAQEHLGDRPLNAGVSELEGWGACVPHNFWQITVFTAGWAAYMTQVSSPPRIFRFPTALI